MVAPITARSPTGQPPGRYRERSRAEYAAGRNVILDADETHGENLVGDVRGWAGTRLTAAA